MKLEIGKLYEVVTDDAFWIKPESSLFSDKEIARFMVYSSWPTAYANNDLPHKHLYEQFVLFLGTEIINKDVLNKFLWNNKYVYIRHFSFLEYEYRFEEVKIDEI